MNKTPHPKTMLKLLLSLVTKHLGAKQQAQRTDLYQKAVIDFYQIFGFDDAKSTMVPRMYF